jgi:hypothetical protein
MFKISVKPVLGAFLSTYALPRDVMFSLEFESCPDPDPDLHSKYLFIKLPA